MKKEKQQPEQSASDKVMNSDSPVGEASAYRPEMMIPFSCTREDAINACREYYRGRWLLPGILQKEEHYQEMQGGFVPYLLYTGEADAAVLYEAQDSREVTGEEKIRKQIREFSVRREARVSYRRVQVNASKDVPESFMHELEPFRYKDLVPVENTEEASLTEGLDSIRIDEDSAISRQRITEVVLEPLKESVKHNYAEIVEQNITINNEKVECVLFPMWVLISKVGRRYYHFAMNGQTGKISGDLPLDSKKAFLAFFGPLFCVGGAGYGLMRLVFLLMGTPHPNENANLLLLLVAMILGMTVASNLMTRLYAQMRKPKEKKGQADKRYESVKVNFTKQNEKLLRKQLVDAKNRVIREEDYGVNTPGSDPSGKAG